MITPATHAVAVENLAPCMYVPMYVRTMLHINQLCFMFMKEFGTAQYCTGN